MVRPRAPISRAELLARAGSNLARDAWYRPEVRPIEIRGVPALVKDYGRRPFPLRATVGHFSVWREVTIYTVLTGIPGIPRFLGQIDAHAFAVERIGGRTVGAYRKERLPAGFLERLSDLVTEIHRRGVVHFDLRQRQNVIVGPGGEPYIIDFASGVRFPIDSPLLRMFEVTDLSGVAKLKGKHAPDTLTARERRLLRLDSFRLLRRLGDHRRRERRRRRREARRRRREMCAS